MTSCLRSLIILCVTSGLEVAHGMPAIGIYTDLQGTQCAGSTTNGFLQGSVWADATEGITGAEFGIYCNRLWSGEVQLLLYPEPGTLCVGDPQRCPLSPAELQIPDPPLVEDSSADDPPPGGWDWRRCGECICWCGDANRDSHDDGIGGVSIVFSGCQAGPRVRLLTFVLIERVPIDDVTLHIVERNPPSNPYFCCPLLTLCDEPAFTKVCVNGGEHRNGFPLIFYTPQAVINPRAAVPCKPLSAGPLTLQSASWSAVKSLYR